MTGHSDNLHGVVGQWKERETYRGRMEKKEGDMPTHGLGSLPQSVVWRVREQTSFCFWQTSHSFLLIIFQDSYYLVRFGTGEVDTSPCSHRWSVVEPGFKQVWVPPSNARGSWRARDRPACSLGLRG